MAQADPANDGPTPDESAAAAKSRRRRAMSVAFFALGVVLLAAAVYAVVSQREAVQAAWEAASGASPLLIAACIVLPAGNWLAATGTLWVLSNRFGRVRFGEMSALIGAAWLLNLLPMRPGMVGRVAYHRRFNGIRVRDSVRVLVAAMLCTGCALALLLLAVTLARGVNERAGRAGVVALLAAPALVAAMGGVVLRAAMGGEGRGGHAWRWPVAMGFRYLDMATWGIRYALVFALIGHPVDVLGAGALTAVGQLAMLTPIQLGLREWAVGMATAALPGVAGQPPQLAEATVTGLIGDGVMRAAELLVVLPVGLTGAGWVWRRMRAAGESAKDAGAEAQQAEREHGGTLSARPEQETPS